KKHIVTKNMLNHSINVYKSLFGYEENIGQIFSSLLNCSLKIFGEALNNRLDKVIDRLVFILETMVAAHEIIHEITNNKEFMLDEGGPYVDGIINLQGKTNEKIVLWHAEKKEDLHPI
ncbi:hypothetical protein ACJX0J_019560, partial [Zea mays]